MKKAEDQAEAEGDCRSPAGARLFDSPILRPDGRGRCSRDGAASSAGLRDGTPLGFSEAQAHFYELFLCQQGGCSGRRDSPPVPNWALSARGH